MALDKWTNIGLSTLASGIDASQTTATLATGTGSRFPADSFNVVIWNSTDFANPIDASDREIVRCTSRSGDVLTITRGQEGTSGTAHNTGGKTYSVALIVSAKFRDDLQREVDVDQNIAWKSGTNFKGLFDHANTADRGYFFPDYNKDIGATVDATEATATSTETTLKTISIEGGKLGPNRIVRVVAHFTWDAGNATGTLRLKYGGTTVATVTTPAATNPFVAVFYLYGDGGTSAQRGSGSANGAGFGFGTAAIDSTVNQNLVLTGQAQGGDQMRLQHFSLEYL